MRKGIFKVFNISMLMVAIISVVAIFYWNTHSNHVDENVPDTMMKAVDAPSDTIYWGIEETKLIISSNESDTEVCSTTKDSFLITDSTIPWTSYKPSITSIQVLGNVQPNYVSNWFMDCSNVESIDLAGLNTTKVDTMANMFNGCSSLSNLDLSKFNTKCVTEMRFMFKDCSKLLSLDLSGFDTTSVSSMNGMFLGCSSLVSINLSSFDTTKVDTMANMFLGCSSLSSLDLSNFNTSKVTTMFHMFEGCSKLTSLDLSMFNTAKVKSMNGIFLGCIGLTELNISNFDILSDTNIGDMFKDCTSLTTLHTPKTIGNNVDLPSGGCLWKKSDGSSIATANKLTSAEESTTLIRNHNFEVADSWQYDDDNHWKTTCTICNLKSDIERHNFTYTDNKNGTHQVSCSTCNYSKTEDNTYIDNNNGTHQAKCQDCNYSKTEAHKFDTSTNLCVCGAVNAPIYWGINGTTLIISSNASDTASCDPKNSFSSAEHLTNIPWDSNKAGITSIQVLGNVQPYSTRSWFSGFSNLGSVDLTGLDTICVTDMALMFANCSSLTSISVSNFDTSKVDQMTSMFYGCSSLTSLDLSSFDTTNVTAMSNMFSGCSNLTSLDLSSFDLTNVKTMNTLFQNCNALNTIKVSQSLANKLETSSNSYLYGSKTWYDVDGIGYTDSNKFSNAGTYTTIVAGTVISNGEERCYKTFDIVWNKALAAGEATVIMNADATISQTLEVGEGKNITLDLNGYKLTMAGDTGSVININGEFTLMDSRPDSKNKITNPNNTSELIDINGGVITGGKGTGTPTLGGGVVVGKKPEGETSIATFTMNGGTIAGNCAEFGGGIRVDTKGKFIMNDGAISYNKAVKDGGGLCVCHAQEVTLNGGSISNNSAIAGGGIYFEGQREYTINNIVISNNTVKLDDAIAYSGKGGGIYIDKSTVIMKNGTISNNEAYNGAGVYLDGNFTMSGGTITENLIIGTEACFGGGVYVADVGFKVSGLVNITGNLNNSLPDNVYLFDSRIQIIDSLNSKTKIGVHTNGHNDIATGYTQADKPAKFFNIDDSTKNCVYDDAGFVYIGVHTGGTATCTKKAECENCGEAYGEIDSENHDVATAWTAAGGVHYHVCNNGCGTRLDEESHTYLEVVSQEHVKSPATCTELAVYYKSCECGAHSDVTFTSGTTIDHTLKSVNKVSPTCTEEGVLAHDECTVCHKLFIDGVEKTAADLKIAIIAHTKGEAVRENEVASTCTKEGSYEEVVYCSECHTELSRTEKTIDKLAHTPGDAVRENEVASTCTKEGSYEEVVYCRVCETELSRTEKTIDKLAHTPGEPVGENEVASTCTKEGTYHEVVYCKVCETELSRTEKTIDKLAHTPGEPVRENEVASTCTKEGSYEEVVYCSVCRTEQSRESKTIDKINHTPAKPVKENEVASTCTKEGTYDEVVYCSVCHTELSRESKTIEKLNHTPAKPVKENEVASTCAKEGSYEEVVYCSVCHTELSRTKKAIEKLAHTPAKPVKENEVAPTCTQPGSYDEVVYCSVCNTKVSSESKAIDKLSHSLEKHDSKLPTCTEKGWKVYVSCKNCDYTTYSEYAALGHQYGEWVLVKESTIEEFGIMQRVCEHDHTHIETIELPKRIAQLIEKGENEGELDKVIVSQSNGLDPKVELSVTEISEKNYNQYETIASTIQGTIELIYDVTLKSDGVEVQPDGMLKIKLRIPNNLKDKAFHLFHLHGKETIDMEYVIEENYAVVETNKLSEFIFVKDKEPEPSSGPLGPILISLLVVSILGEGGYLTYYFLKKKGIIKGKKSKLNEDDSNKEDVKQQTESN